MWFKRLYIKCCRYLLGMKYLRIMSGPLKGYRFTTERNYEYLLGDYDAPEVMEIFATKLGNCKVLYDLGAAVGFHSLLADRYMQSGRIIAFEPFPPNRTIFEQHLRLNHHKLRGNAIEILPYAVAGEKKELLFSNNELQHDGNTYITGSSVFGEGTGALLVQAVTIDGLVAGGYPLPGLIKIDVEGAEYDVLKGAAKTIEKSKPIILLATHECHLPGVKENCLAFLRAMDYTIYYTGHYNQQVKGIDDYICWPGQPVNEQTA